MNELAHIASTQLLLKRELKFSEKWRLKSWTDGIYAVVKADYNAKNEFPENTDDDLFNLDMENFDIGGAGTPSQFTHKTLAAIGYKFSIDKYPSTIAFGGSYEFATANHELEGYAFWGKFCISF